jgi:mannobiose 2-epimerase
MDVSRVAQAADAEATAILTWWDTHALQDDGTYVGEIAGDGTRHPTADQSLVVATRLLYTFSRAVNEGRAPVERWQARLGPLYAVLLNRYWDADYLGFYWSVGADGQPADDRKHVYGHAFALYALSEYAAASGLREAVLLAQLVDRLLRQYAADPEHGGFYEVFTRTWARRPTEADPVAHGAVKTMNTHLHLLEAYTRFYRLWPAPEVAHVLEQLLDILTRRMWDPAFRHFRLYFTADWRPLGQRVSYGHDIEASWLLTDAADALGDPAWIRAVHALVPAIVDAVAEEGLDRDGGLFYEGEGGTPVDRTKAWWPQAEACVGFVNAYQVTGAVRYLEQADAVWQFITSTLVDPAGGEWWQAATAAGQPDRTLPKVSAWKGPYHNYRACAELARRLAAP